MVPLCLLPVIYALTIASEEETIQLRNALQSMKDNPVAMKEIRAHLENVGAGLYLITKAEEFSRKALKSLEGMNLHSSIYNELENFINKLSFKEPIK
jgi:geranylgeranyl pyrophosphate synthase